MVHGAKLTGYNIEKGTKKLKGWIFVRGVLEGGKERLSLRYESNTRHC